MNKIEIGIKHRDNLWSGITLIVGIVFLLITSCNLPDSPVVGVEPELLRTVVDETFTVGADDYEYYLIKVSSEEQGRLETILTGDFTASGGSDNCIELFFLDEKNFWRADSGHPFSPGYSSGRVSYDSFTVMIPDTNQYYLVYSNTFCDTVDKVVTSKVGIYIYD